MTPPLHPQGEGWTKGPWEVRQSQIGTLYVSSTEGREVARVIFRPFGEHEANARLIAAAPDLYEALSDAVMFIELVRLRARREGDTQQEIEAQDALRNAQSALTKARTPDTLSEGGER